MTLDDIKAAVLTATSGTPRLFSFIWFVDWYNKNREATPEATHAAWLEFMLGKGWKYGDSLRIAEYHPCILAWDFLPDEHKTRYVVAIKTFNDMKGLLNED